MKFYDRDKELAILQANEQQSFESAVFTVLMGRRRIGKTSTHHKVLEKRSMPTSLSPKTRRLYCAKISKETWSSR